MRGGAEILLLDPRTSFKTSDVRFPSDVAYGENEHAIRVFILAYAAFLQDSPLGQREPRLVKKFIGSLSNKHISVIIRNYALLSHEILSGESSFGTDTHPYHKSMEKTPIYREYLHWYKTDDAETLRFIISFLTFGKKLDYEDPEFHTTAFRGWLDVEEKLSTLKFDDITLNNLRNIIRCLIDDPENFVWLPKHGPGRVAERGVSTVDAKHDVLALDPKLALTFAKKDENFRERGLAASQHPTRRVDRSLESLLAFVPKDIRTARSICMEPATYMYFQQEVLRYMVTSIEEGRASRFIDLRDQTKNQARALHGSIYHGSDTLDLSAASDSVHVDLVRGIFSGPMLRYMLATRSSFVRTPDGASRKLFKFAPMGSAVCFPTQCLVFLSICIYAARCATESKDILERTISVDDYAAFIDTAFHSETGKTTAYSRRYEPPRIFGDDIICDVRTTDYVIFTLGRLGFTVNRSKSFTGSSPVRESCGIYAYKGQDVTPFLYRVPLHNTKKLPPHVYSSIIGAINHARDHGWFRVRAYLIRYVQSKIPLNIIPYVLNPDMFGILVERKKFRQDGVRYRINASLQRGEQRILAVRTTSPDWCDRVDLEEYRNSLWWRTRVRIDVPPPLGGRRSRIRPEETRYVRAWSPYV
jgi:hypothetical protein